MMYIPAFPKILVAFAVIISLQACGGGGGNNTPPPVDLATSELDTPAPKLVTEAMTINPIDEVVLEFDSPLDPSSIDGSISMSEEGGSNSSYGIQVALSDDGKQLHLKPLSPYENNKHYTLDLSTLKGLNGKPLAELEYTFSVAKTNLTKEINYRDGRISSYTSYEEYDIYKNSNIETVYETKFDYAGEDTVWFTHDDVLSEYRSTIELSPTDTIDATYYSPGQDRQWFT